MYHNTNNEQGETLIKSEIQTNRQETVILELFKDKILSPHEVLSLSGLNCPITSIRRAITNLTNQGLLIKTTIMREGEYGKMVHTWRLNEGNQLEMF